MAQKGPLAGENINVYALATAYFAEHPVSATRPRASADETQSIKEKIEAIELTEDEQQAIWQKSSCNKVLFFFGLFGCLLVAECF
jgi:hypothetical protein